MGKGPIHTLKISTIMAIGKKIGDMGLDISDLHLERIMGNGLRTGRRETEY